jgi:hypothetical protein
VFSSPGAGFDGNGTEGGGAALGEDNSVDAGSVGHTKKRAQILGIFDAVEGQQEAGSRIWAFWLEQVFDGQKLHGAHHRDDTLMGGGSGELGQLLARLLANGDSGRAAGSDYLFEAGVLTFAGHNNLIKTPPAGLEGLFNRVDAI